MSKAIMVAKFTSWNTSLSFLIGKTPKVTMWCGECRYEWSTRFRPIDFQNGYPKSCCPNCGQVNYVPLKVS
jgi:hypothetical protein